MKLVNHYTALVTLLLAAGLAMPSSILAEDSASRSSQNAITKPRGAVPAEQSEPRTIGAVPPAGAGKLNPSCMYPRHSKRQVAKNLALDILNLDEIESNETTNTAQALPLGPAFGQSLSIDVNAGLSSNGDVDFYSFIATKGDVIGIAALGGPVPDMTLALTLAGGTEIIENFDHGFQANLYAPNSPLPGGADEKDAALAWVVPAGGTYFIRAQSDSLVTNGSYTLQVRASRPGVALQRSPDIQIVWLDFDGATINARETFGFGSSSADLKPLSHFLQYWELQASDEDAVIDAILATVHENYDDLRLASLNGNRPTDSIAGHMHIEFRNSRDHGDLWGQPNVARVVVGGSQFALGIEVLGIAQYLDVGNFATEDTAVVLLDYFSASAEYYPDSANAVPLDPSVDIIDAIGIVVGYTVSHELGHLLGNWHTENDNTLLNVMDKGGDANAPLRRSGVGPDMILGTADDIDVDFITDDYDSEEEISYGLERTTYRTAFGLSTGAGTLYVDQDNNSGTELGSFSFPYNTLIEGYSIVIPRGTVILMGGDYSEIITLTKPAQFDATGGTAMIGIPPP